MKLLLFAGLLVAGYLVSVAVRGRRGFWGLVGDHPGEAYRHIQSDTDAWHIAEERPGPASEWHGPFRLLEPMGGTLVTFWGHDPDYLESQARFVKRIRECVPSGPAR